MDIDDLMSMVTSPVQEESKNTGAGALAKRRREARRRRANNKRDLKNPVIIILCSYFFIAASYLAYNGLHRTGYFSSSAVGDVYYNELSTFVDITHISKAIDPLIINPPGTVHALRDSEFRKHVTCEAFVSIMLSHIAKSENITFEIKDVEVCIVDFNYLSNITINKASLFEIEKSGYAFFFALPSTLPSPSSKYSALEIIIDHNYWQRYVFKDDIRITNSSTAFLTVPKCHYESFAKYWFSSDLNQVLEDMVKINSSFHSNFNESTKTNNARSYLHDIITNETDFFNFERLFANEIRNSPFGISNVFVKPIRKLYKSFKEDKAVLKKMTIVLYHFFNGGGIQQYSLSSLVNGEAQAQSSNACIGNSPKDSLIQSMLTKVSNL